MILLSRVPRYSRLGLTQGQPWNTLPSNMMALARRKCRMFEMDNHSFSGLDILKRPPWSLLLQGAMFMPIMKVATGDLVDVCSLGCYLKPC